MNDWTRFIPYACIAAIVALIGYSLITSHSTTQRVSTLEQELAANAVHEAKAAKRSARESRRGLCALGRFAATPIQRPEETSDSYSKRLRDFRAFRAILRGYDCRRVLSGHLGFAATPAPASAAIPLPALDPGGGGGGNGQHRPSGEPGAVQGPQPATPTPTPPAAPQTGLICGLTGQLGAPLCIGL